jgi:hypothetical protein
LVVVLRKRIGLLGLKKIVESLTRILFSTLVMVAGVALTYGALKGLHPAVSVFGSIMAGFLLFAGTAKAVGTEELAPVLSLLRREPPQDE